MPFRNVTTLLGWNHIANGQQLEMDARIVIESFTVGWPNRCHQRKKAHWTKQAMPAQLATLPSPAWSSAVCCDYYVICTRHHNPTYGYITLVEFLNPGARAAFLDSRRISLSHLEVGVVVALQWCLLGWHFHHCGAKEDDPENGWNFLVCEEPARGAQQKKQVLL